MQQKQKQLKIENKVISQSLYILQIYNTSLLFIIIIRCSVLSVIYMAQETEKSLGAGPI